MQVPSRSTKRGDFYMLPVRERDGSANIPRLKTWLSLNTWAVRRSAWHRSKFKQGDQCCFFADRFGVVATAEIAGGADQEVSWEDWPGPADSCQGMYELPLTNVEWLPSPIRITSELRASLDAFAGKPSSPWAWFVQNTTCLTEHDFQILTGRG